MALTRKLLKGMGLTDEQADTIVEAHMETVDALKKERDDYKVDADKLPDVQKELNTLKEAGDGGFEKKYNDEHTAFENYKASVAEEKVNAQKDGLYRDLLKSLKVDSKRIDAIMKVTDLKEVKVKDGKLENEDKLTESIKSEWSSFMVTERTDGAHVEDPPAGNEGNGTDLGSMSMEDYIAARKKM